MRYDLESTLPEKAFKKSLFKNAPATLEGGKGGGGGAPTTSTAYQTQIPEYARPYVESMLGATQKQLFQTTPGENGAPDQITGFQKYKPYSTNASDYVAGFSPLQQQAQSGTANLQVPGQYGQAAGMTGMAGMGALGTTRGAGMYGAMGAQQGLGFGQQAQDPNAVQSYMNPYLQASLDPQLAEIQRQYDITGQGQQSQAAKQGAFGGSREALMSAENQRNKNMAMNQAIGQGYNNAFNNAQQQMATAAQMGMQGAGLGLQGIGAQQAGYGQLGQAASSLAGIGGQELAAQQGILGAQNQMGAQQQQQQQAIINQGIQNYATEQQYPMLQLGTMSNMLRGLPMSQQTVQGYQAQPTALQQGIGVLGAGATLASAMKSGGGEIKSMRSGGITDIPAYRYGGIMNPMEFEAATQKMPDSQLQQIRGLPGVNAGENLAISDAMADHKYLRSNPMAGKLLSAQEAAPPPPPMNEPNPEDRMSGIAMAGGPAFDTINAASGGILSFATGGTTPAVQAPAEPAEDTIEAQMAAQQKYLPQEPLGKQFKEYLDKQEGIDADRLSKKELFAAARGFLKFASTPPSHGGFAGAAAEGLGEFATGVENARDAANKAASDRQVLRHNMELAERAEKRGDFKTANEAMFKIKEIKKDIALQEMRGIQALEQGKQKGEYDLKAAGVHASAANAGRAYEQNMIADYAKENNITPAAAYALLSKGLGTKQERLALDQSKIELDARVKADATLSNGAIGIQYMNLLNSKKPEDQEKARVMRENLIRDYVSAGTPKTQKQSSASTNTDGVDTKNKLLTGN